MEKKYCSKCSIEKLVNDFYFKRKGKKGQNLYTSRCKICTNSVNMSNYYAEDKNQRERRKNNAVKNHLARKFGLTTEEFSTMIVQQNNKCKTCESEMKQPQVDHNHITGKVRGLLCKPCNMSLGLIKENSKTLHNMISYINDSI